MNSINYKALKWLMDISIFTYLFIFILIVAIFGWKQWGENTVSYSIGTSIRENLRIDTTQGTVRSVSTTTVFEPTLEASDVRIRFKTKDTLIKIMFSIVIVIYFGYLLFIMFTLRKFVTSLKSGNPFIVQNVKRLRTIGFLLLMIDPLRWVVSLIFQLTLDNRFQYTGQESNIFSRLFYKLGHNLGSASFISTWIIAGLIVLVIAEVFKQGLKMKHEQDLTI